MENNYFDRSEDNAHTQSKLNEISIRKKLKYKGNEIILIIKSLITIIILFYYYNY
jgi:hypothetical protein